MAYQRNLDLAIAGERAPGDLGINRDIAWGRRVECAWIVLVGNADHLEAGIEGFAFPVQPATGAPGRDTRYVYSARQGRTHIIAQRGNLQDSLFKMGQVVDGLALQATEIG